MKDRDDLDQVTAQGRPEIEIKMISLEPIGDASPGAPESIVEAAAVPEAPQAAAVAPSEAAAPGPVLNYTVIKWNGLENYECRECPYATLDELMMQEHQAQWHAPAPAVRQVRLPMYDRYGNPLSISMEVTNG